MHAYASQIGLFVGTQVQTHSDSVARAILVYISKG